MSPGLSSALRAAARLVRLGALLGCVVGTVAPPAQAPIRVATIDGKAIAGTLLGLREGQLVVATPEGEVARPFDEVRTIAQDAAVAAAPVDAGLVVCRSGQVLRGTLVGARTEEGVALLELQVPPVRGVVQIPLRTVAALRFADAPRRDAQAFDDAVHDGSTRDLLFAYRRGDPAADLVRLTVRLVRFQQAGGETQIVVEFDGKEQPPQSVSRMYGLVLGQGAAPDPQPGARTTVRVAGGTEFTGKLLVLDPAADRCVLRLDEGAELDLPWSRIARLDVRSDRLVYLSDLEPVEVAQVPALDRTWPWLRDAAPSGPGIVLHGQTHERGLVLVPRTRLAYDLGGRFDWFEAVVGIDERAGGMGDAVVRVLGDGNVLFEADHVRPGMAPRPVRVSVQGVRRLALEVDFGDSLDIGDHCAFADARLLQDG